LQSGEVDLSAEQKQKLRELGEEFKNLSNSHKIVGYRREHNEHRNYFNKKLSSENIDSLTENEFKELCKNLWAIRGWTKKEWRIENQILTPNGFDKIKSELKKLLYGTEESLQRYDTFRLNIKGLGIASLSEILNMTFPESYCLWNDTHRKVLPYLQLDSLLPQKFFRKPGVGRDYHQCLQLLTEVKSQLAEFGINDFLDLDIFLWHIHEDLIPSSEKKQVRNKNKDTTNNKHHQIALWVVRAGRSGEQEKAALQNNIITIGWNELDNLSSIQDYDLLRRHYSQAYPKQTKNQVGTGSAQVWKFFREIQKDDLIAIPLKSQNKSQKAIAIGQVIGDYEYKKEYGDNIRHTRSINWLKSIPKSEFDNDFLKAFGRRHTVYKIEGAQADHAKTILLKQGITELNTDDKGGLQQAITEEQQEIELAHTIDELSKQTYFPPYTITEIYELLNEKKQIIFYGPPGTSKTYFAKHFAHFFTQNKNNVKIIQFHPSYSYEDFVEGIRPILSETGNAAGFSLQKGILRRIVDGCLETPNQKFVLIIDEINRGNIAKIFGELIYLLEYRKESISLTYSPNNDSNVSNNKTHAVFTLLFIPNHKIL